MAGKHSPASVNMCINVIKVDNFVCEVARLIYANAKNAFHVFQFLSAGIAKVVELMTSGDLVDSRGAEKGVSRTRFPVIISHIQLICQK